MKNTVIQVSQTRGDLRTHDRQMQWGIRGAMLGDKGALGKKLVKQQIKCGG